MNRFTRNQFSDRSVYGSSSSKSEERHRPEMKLRLQVKIPVKPNEEEKNNNPSPPPSPPPPPPPPRRHFCEVCNKEFSCGKAYGGHVRIHSMGYTSKKKNKDKMGMMKKKSKRIVVKKTMEKEEIDLIIRADVEEGGEIQCCLCGKVFQTKQSLFGHMRRHPDRSWKGIQLPLENELVSVNGSSSNSAISSCSSDPDYDYVFDDDDDYETMRSSMREIQEAARCLIMLSCSRSSHRLGFGVESNSGETKKAKSGVRNSCLYEGKGKEKVLDFESNGDMKITSENELQDRVHGINGDKQTLGFDLNQPYAGEDEEVGNDYTDVM